jgi:hypothetical protein
MKKFQFKIIHSIVLIGVMALGSILLAGELTKAENFTLSD